MPAHSPPHTRRRRRCAPVRSGSYCSIKAGGRVVDEPALVLALEKRQIKGAAIDVTVEEPLAADSPLWAMDHALIAPHTAGEPCRYEENVLAIHARESRAA